MRCEILFDEDKPLLEQEVKAWGEMQTIFEGEPDYKESEIKSVEDKEFFRGYKACLDDMCTLLENMVLDEELAEKESDEIQIRMSSELCMLLFSILDYQEE